MKRVPKAVFFIVAILILLLTYTSIFGVYGQNGDNKITYIKGAGDIRWGIDIRGGVEATFVPADGVDATDEQLSSVEETIKLRLLNNNVTDYELYTDTSNDRIIIRFPWKSDEADFNPEEAIEELAATAELTFREGMEYETQELDENGNPMYKTPTGTYQDQTTGTVKYLVELKFSEDGAKKFADATSELVGKTISVWMDDVMISYPTVESAITEGECTITSDSFTAATATELAQKINAGALPFTLKTDSFGTISPTLGESSLNAMTMAGVIAFALVAVFMLIMFRLPGFVAVIALAGQVALSLIAVSGYFPAFPSFTMTLPGIAGIILSIGMGVDANIITATRIKEELWLGKTLDGAIEKGNESSFWAIFDGNITVIIVAVILMAVFGPSNILSVIFGASTTGSIYSFGYTLLIGVIGNFIMGVTATRLMTKSLSRFKLLRNKWLFGGAQE